MTYTLVPTGLNLRGEHTASRLVLRRLNDYWYVEETMLVGGRQAHSRSYHLDGPKAQERFAALGLSPDVLRDRVACLEARWSKATERFDR